VQGSAGSVGRHAASQTAPRLVWSGCAGTAGHRGHCWHPYGDSTVLDTANLFKLLLLLLVVVVHQVWPKSVPEVRPWHGPPLLTDKVVKLLRWVVVVCMGGGGELGGVFWGGVEAAREVNGRQADWGW
jgi:hypothetical protein